MLELVRGHDPGPLAPALGWVDRRFGPIRRLEPTLHAPPEPRFWVYASDLSRAPAGTHYHPTVSFAAGASVSGSEALRRVLGEAVERYSAAHPPEPGDLFPLRVGESPLWHRFPRCADFEPCPEGFRALHPGVVLSHVRARRLSDGARVPIPAAYVYQDFARAAGEPWIAWGISTGSAFHTDPVQALWGGLCEVAERDAVLSTWWARRAVSRIETGAGVPAMLAQRLARLGEVDLRADLFDIATDFRLPTVFCLLRGPRFPFVVVGASCAADLGSACAKAIDEAIGVRHYVRQASPVAPPSPEEGFGTVRMLADHALLYASWPKAPSFDFLYEADPVPFADLARGPWWPIPRTEDELRERARALETMGLTPLWADITIPEAGEMGRVVKVVVPEMVPLSPDHASSWLATPRLCRMAGVSEPRPEAFNPFPHPFA
jgi:ribosomal protein S12 methylthiotransferase accessory factor